jgi:beta-glucosidase
VLDGIKNKVSAGTVVHYAKGCGIRSTSREGFTEAVEAARKSDVAILVVGGSSARDFGENTHDNVTGAAVVTDSLSEISDMDSGEGFDRASLELSGVQLDLVKEIKKTGVPVIVVLINGRPLILNWVDESVDGLLEAWYPGQEGGNAIADVLFGDYNPAGRLPISFPRSEGQLPVYYNQKRYERKRYVEMEATPLFSFGFGLSYTDFRYENLNVEPAAIKPDESAVVSVDITNTGAVKGDEVVQLYLRDEYSSIARRSIELKGFERISLEPGERRSVEFVITPEKLQFLDAHMEPTVEPGLFKIMLGGSQNDMIKIYLEVVAG